MKSKKPSIILGLMIFSILIFSSSVFLYRNIVNTIKDTQNESELQLKTATFDSIYMYMNSLISQANNDVTDVGDNIKKDLLTLSSEDLQKMQDDMDNQIYNDTLNDIIYKNTNGECLNGINNHKNGILVFSDDGVIEDYNYRRAESEKDSEKSNTTIRTWEYDINHAYNKNLAKSSVDKLLNRTSGIIAFESYDLIDSSSLLNAEQHILISEFNYSNLKKVYLKEGLEGLRNYQIYVPYYITDSGDIFGKEDIVHGVRQDNNKLIIVQEFNLWDQLKNNSQFIDNEKTIKLVDEKHNEVLRSLYMFGLVITSAIIVLIFYFCNAYNQLVESGRLGEHFNIDKEEDNDVKEDDHESTDHNDTSNYI